MDTVSVSIIIVNYNQQRLLTNLLLFLSENNWCHATQVIVVDNASKELADVNILKNQYSDILFIINKFNYGPSKARNIGLANATGRYIQFLDSDDWISPDKIRLQYNEAVRLNYPTMIVSSWATVKTSDNQLGYEIISNNTPKIKYPLALTFILENNFIPLMSGIILRDRLLSIDGFDETMWFVEDVNIAIKLSSYNSDFYLLSSEEPLFFYRIGNPDSLSLSNNREFNRANLKNYLLVKKKLGATDVINKASQNIWNIYFTSVVTNDKPTMLAIKEDLYSINVMAFEANLRLKIASLAGFKNFFHIYQIYSSIKEHLR